jgi:hypothetical protein
VPTPQLNKLTQSNLAAACAASPRETQAKRLADEYDAAQERGEINRRGANQHHLNEKKLIRTRTTVCIRVDDVMKSPKLAE